MLKWHRLPQGYASADGTYLIEKIWAPGAHGYAWYLWVPNSTVVSTTGSSTPRYSQTTTMHARKY